MGTPKDSLTLQSQLPNFSDPESIFDLLNFRLSELMGISGSLVTRMCENEYGITREEWQFLAMLAELGGMSPSDLAALTTVDRSQASKTLRGLISKNLVERHTIPGDGRRARVLLTPAGSALFDQVFPRVVQFHHELLQDLTTIERQALALNMCSMQARALTVAKQHMPNAANGRRKGGSRSVPTR